MVVIRFLFNFIAISSIFSKRDIDLEILPPPPPFPLMLEEEKSLEENWMKREKSKKTDSQEKSDGLAAEAKKEIQEKIPLGKMFDEKKKSNKLFKELKIRKLEDLEIEVKTKGNEKEEIQTQTFPLMSEQEKILEKKWQEEKPKKTNLFSDVPSSKKEMFEKNMLPPPMPELEDKKQSLSGIYESLGLAKAEKDMKGKELNKWIEKKFEEKEPEEVSPSKNKKPQKNKHTDKELDEELKDLEGMDLLQEEELKDSQKMDSSQNKEFNAENPYESTTSEKEISEAIGSIKQKQRKISFLKGIFKKKDEKERFAARRKAKRISKDRFYHR